MTGVVVNFAGCRLRRLSRALLGHDYAKAFHLAHPLALDGDPKAQGVVGALHFIGEGGCPHDLMEAWAWLSLSERGGYCQARELLDLVERELSAAGLVEAANRSLSIVFKIQRRSWERLTS